MFTLFEVVPIPVLSIAAGLRDFKNNWVLWGRLGGERTACWTSIGGPDRGAYGKRRGSELTCGRKRPLAAHASQ
ncbi:hypothetical protein N8T08_011175 [Aspergillus melleus]|uniref:Uncharacterized protein n=1 Tax=Aspergillus melleus TaxID=138277 RepID=A0ACC3AQ99_9EURO|nr:hypothetical protein N8T08_011175 [Aspergillus melleus]